MDLTKENAIKIGIIGCGKQAGVHAQILSETNLYEIVALCDINRKNARSLADSLELSQDVFITEDYKECIDRPDVEAVIIATHTNAHVEQALYAISKNKHVLLEKPMGRNIAEVDRLCMGYLNSNVIVYPALEFHHSHLFDNLMYYINSDFLDGTKFISISEFRSNFFLPWFYDSSISGGAINDKLIHFFDLVCSCFAPSKPVRVFASGAQHVYKAGSTIIGMGEVKQTLEKSDIVDNATIIIEFEDDKRATIQLQMYEMLPVEGLQIFVAGLNGTFIRVINADTPDSEIITNHDGTLSRYVLGDKSDSDSLGASHPGSKELFLRFAVAVRTHDKQFIDVYGMRRAQVLAFAAEESIKRGQPVLVEEFTNKQLDELAVEKGAGYNEQITFHPVIDPNSIKIAKKKKPFAFLSHIFRSRHPTPYVRLTRRVMMRIVNSLNKSFEFPDLGGLAFTMKLITPWDIMYIRFTNGQIHVDAKDISQETDKELELFVTESGFEGFLRGVSLNQLYFTQQVRVVGDISEVRQFRSSIVKLLDEIKRHCIIE